MSFPQLARGGAGSPPSEKRRWVFIFVMMFRKRVPRRPAAPAESDDFDTPGGAGLDSPFGSVPGGWKQAPVLTFRVLAWRSSCDVVEKRQTVLQAFAGWEPSRTYGAGDSSLLSRQGSRAQHVPCSCLLPNLLEINP